MAKAKKKVDKKAQDELKETGLKVSHEVYCITTRERNPDDRWSGEDTSSTHSVDGLSLAKEWPDVTAPFFVKPGDVVYLLFAVYSSGDSFSHHENGSIIYIDVFKTHAKAEKAAQTIREHANWYKGLHSRWEPMTNKQRKALAKKYKSEHSVEIVRENGKKIDVYANWNGYFESLSYIEVSSCTVDAVGRGRY
jgi:hypothetical protein